MHSIWSLLPGTLLWAAEPLDGDVEEGSFAFLEKGIGKLFAFGFDFDQFELIPAFDQDVGPDQHPIVEIARNGATLWTMAVLLYLVLVGLGWAYRSTSFLFKMLINVITCINLI